MNLPVSFQDLSASPEACTRLVRGICLRHGLPLEARRMEEGSQIVYSAGERWIVKIFAPEDAEFHRSESVFLAGLHGRLPFPTPEPLAADTLDGWPYLVMGQLTGIPLSRVWKELPAPEQETLMRRLGEGVRALHALPASLFRESPFEWGAFIDTQCATLLERHRAFGLEEPWLERLPELLAAGRLDLHDKKKLVPLHTELMPEHVFVRPAAGEPDGWSISGLIDWEPSMIGHADYELCAVGIFLTPGRPDLFRAYLSGYGGSELLEEGRSGAIGRRALAMLLLHRYGNVRRFRSRIPAEQRIESLDDLERYWYGT